MKPFASFIILTWNSEKYIQACLRSIPKSILPYEYEIIVIDNGSSDDSINVIKSSSLEITLIQNTKNKGVAFARNQGIRISKGEYLIILDIDTILNSGSISVLIYFMEMNHEIGLCAPQLVSEKGEIHESGRKFPTLYSKLCRRINLKFAEKYSNQNFYHLNKVNTHIEIDYAVGACQVIRKTTINKIGLLDENIFYGAEDIDFCLRLWFNGWKIIYYPYVNILHFEQRLTKKHFFSKLTFEHLRGLIYFFVKHKYFMNKENLYDKISMANYQNASNNTFVNNPSRAIYFEAQYLK